MLIPRPPTPTQAGSNCRGRSRSGKEKLFLAASSPLTGFNDVLDSGC